MRIAQHVIKLVFGMGLCVIIFKIDSAVFAQDRQKNFQQIVADTAVKEWFLFNAPNRSLVQSRQDVKSLESAPIEYKKCKEVSRYWSAVPFNKSRNNKPPNGDACSLNNPPNPSGLGDLSKWNRFPWSAAFVSYVMKQAGAGKSFIYSGRHSVYIVDSVRNRDSKDYPFKGYAVDQVRPEVGDLICAPRGKNRDMRFSEILIMGDFESHCDIVVSKNDDKSIEVIGGNVGDTIAKTIVKLNSKGYVRVSGSDFRPWLVVIKNNLKK